MSTPTSSCATPSGIASVPVSLSTPTPPTSPTQPQLSDVDALRVRYILGSDTALELAVQQGLVVVGRLHVFKSWGSGLCFVRNVCLPRDVVLNQMDLRGSALHGDVVAVELAHRLMWQVDCTERTKTTATTTSKHQKSNKASATSEVNGNTDHNNSDDPSRAKSSDTGDDDPPASERDENEVAVLREERELARRGRLPDGRRIQRRLRRETKEEVVALSSEEVRLMKLMDGPLFYDWPQDRVPVGRVIRVLHRDMKLLHVAHLASESVAASAQRKGSTGNGYYRFRPYNPLLPQLVVHQCHIPHQYHNQLDGKLFLLRLLTNHDKIPDMTTRQTNMREARNDRQSHVDASGSASSMPSTPAHNPSVQLSCREESLPRITTAPARRQDQQQCGQDAVAPAVAAPDGTERDVHPIPFCKDMLRCVIVALMGRADSVEVNNMAISAAYNIASDVFPDDVEACVPTDIDIPSPAVMRAIQCHMEAQSRNHGGNIDTVHRIGSSHEDRISQHCHRGSQCTDDRTRMHENSCPDRSSAETSCDTCATQQPPVLNDVDTGNTDASNASSANIDTNIYRRAGTRRANDHDATALTDVSHVEDTIEVTPDLVQTWGHRRDLRIEEFVCTIDPATARDLDDALSIRRVHGTGGYRVGVHIADVSFFVKLDTAIDAEARKRGTTFYLVDKVVPMLPRRLSEHICSLNPGEDKLTFSALFDLDRHGEVTSEWFGQSITRSACRLSYEQAQSILEGHEIELPGADADRRSDNNADGDEGRAEKEALRRRRVYQTVHLLHEVAAKRRAASFARGRLTLNNSRLSFQFTEKDSKLAPCGFGVSRQIPANWIVEEFMLLANTRVAEKIVQFMPDEALLRTHASPKWGKMAFVKEVLRQKGFQFTGSSAKDLQGLLDHYRDHPHAAALAELIKLALPSANYSTNTSHDMYTQSCVEKDGSNGVGGAGGGASSSHPARMRKGGAGNSLEECVFGAHGGSSASALAKLSAALDVAMPAPTGHFALGLTWYTHFTSPIRRYSDLMVHRQLRVALELERDDWQASPCSARDGNTTAHVSSSTNTGTTLTASSSSRIATNETAAVSRLMSSEHMMHSEVTGIALYLNTCKENARQASERSAEFFFCLYLLALKMKELSTKGVAEKPYTTAMLVKLSDSAVVLFAEEIAFNKSMSWKCDSTQRFVYLGAVQENKDEEGVPAAAAATKSPAGSNPPRRNAGRQNGPSWSMRGRERRGRYDAKSPQSVRAEAAAAAANPASSPARSRQKDQRQVKVSWGCHPVTGQEVTEELGLFSVVTVTLEVLRKAGELRLGMIIVPPWEREHLVHAGHAIPKSLLY